jgi:glucose-6-phosphate isomerase
MIQINFENLFKTGAIKKSDFEKSGKNLPTFLKQIESRNQGFYQIFSDESFLSEVEQIKVFASSVAGKYDDIVVCGIGGSALGTMAIRDALRPFFSHKKPHLHVLENIDPDLISDLSDHLVLARTLFLVISKSGGTPETISQYLYFHQKVEAAGLSLKDHFVVITGDSGFLKSEVEQHNLPQFTVPDNVGGRFSVLTSVGLLPAALMGIDIDALLSGGEEMVELFLSNNFDQNMCFQLASAQFLSKKTNQVLMPYATKLRSFSAWFTQLLAESTGKEGKGFTPISALGATDQHSQLQLFSDGPNDKLILFLEVQHFTTDPVIPVLVDHEKTCFLKNITFGKLLNTELAGTRADLTEKKRPNLTISIDSLSEETLGALFLLFEGSTAFLGEFLEVNAFDQPGVERSKVLTREYLSRAKESLI